MKISIIVAVAQGNVIGYKNKLPWRLPADLKHFKEITSGHHVIMGQKTFESIGKPLPQRTNIILTLDKNYNAKGCIIAHSLEGAIKVAEKNNEEEVFIIGGASVYKQAIEIADRIYLTKIHQKFKGDTYFPKIEKSKWKEIKKEVFSEVDGLKFDFIVLDRISAV